MKIYDYDRDFSPYTRYTNYNVDIKNKMLYKISSIPDSDFYYITLGQNILQNRPFKALSYLLCSTNMMSNSIRQEIMTNIRYRPERKEKIYFSIKYFIDRINSENMNCSKLDIQILYRVMNHFIHKNNKK